MYVDRSSYVDDGETVVLGISGGPDSMGLFFSCMKFLQQQSNYTFTPVVCTCNHGQRSASADEVNMVQNVCAHYAIDCVVCQYEEGERNEQTLRIWRHQQFLSVTQQYDATKIILGHHLGDRIESFMLNLARGCDLQGLRSLQTHTPHFLDPTKIIVRPLLAFTKSQIQHYCDQYQVPYVIDPTNQDPHYSKRNLIRNNLFPLMDQCSHMTKEGEQVWMRSMQTLFQYLDHHHSSLPLSLRPIRLHPERKAKQGYELQGEISLDTLAQVLKKCGLYANITKKILTELVGFFYHSSSGYKYRNGTYFRIAHGKYYIIQAPKDFRVHYVTSSPSLFFTGKEENIPNVENNNKSPHYRYPKSGDRYHGKTLNKYLINQKVPVFVRKFVLVREEDEKIVEVIKWRKS